jgi:hypothetical protein
MYLFYDLRVFKEIVNSSDYVALDDRMNTK